MSKNIDRYREYQKKYREENKDKIKELHRKWFENHREYRAEYQRNYYKTSKGREAVKKAVKKYEQNNRERRKVWNLVCRIKSGRCIVCGKSPAHKHHPDISQPYFFVYLCPLHHKHIERKVV